jgi:hypothetical protein
MKGKQMEVVRGSGNVFRDLGRNNADAEQFKAILAAEIIKALDREHLTVRAAHSRTGIAAAHFSLSSYTMIRPSTHFGINSKRISVNGESRSGSAHGIGDAC